MSNWIKGLFNTQEIDRIDDIKEEPQTPISKIKGIINLINSETTFLVTLVDNGFKEFILRSEDRVYGDPALEKLAMLFEKDEIVSLINSLENKRYLLRKDLEPTLQCPHCYSSDVKVVFSCPKCNSQHITKSEIYEHPYCGYRDVKSAFITAGNFICPKCKTELFYKENDQQSSEQKKVQYIHTYHVNGSLFECNNCKNKMNKPSIDFHCKRCGIHYNYINAIYQIPIKYTIPDNIYNKIILRNKVNLLIVEDFAPEAEVLSMLLSTSDLNNVYNIDISNNGKEAIKLFERNNYNLVILDLGLPDIDGITLLSEIKKINPDVKVIVYTGYDDREIAVKAMKIGASEFLIKNNDDIDSLLNIVDKIMSERKNLE